MLKTLAQELEKCPSQTAKIALDVLLRLPLRLPKTIE
jgi:hypothetical protein